MGHDHFSVERLNEEILLTVKIKAHTVSAKKMVEVRYNHRV
jgi:hypothetical protein